MVALTETPRRQNQHLIIYGEPKTGKSTLVSQLALDGWNLLWISMDGGHEVLYKLPKEAQDRINLINLKDTPEFSIAFPTCKTLLKHKATKLCTAHGQAECSTCKGNKDAGWEVVNLMDLPKNSIVVMDHLSQVAESALLLAMSGKKAEDRAEWEHYRAQGALMHGLLSAIQQSVCNIVAITHVTETVQEDGTKKLVPQVGTTNFSNNSGKYFDHVVHIGVENKKHAAGSSTVYKLKAVTGSRSDVAIETQTAMSLSPFFNKE